jgi:hypothetical protein
MKINFLKITAIMVILGITNIANAQWSLSGNSLSGT